MAPSTGAWFARHVKTVEVDDADLEPPNDEGDSDEVSSDRRTDEFLSQMDGQSQLSEVEIRLEKARYYRLLIDQPLFTDSTPAGEEVLSEIRDFVRHRMNVLVGLEQEKQVVSDIFDESEVAALKQVAARLLGRTELRQVQTPPAAPAVRPAIVPPAPAVRPVAAPQPPPKQERKPVEAPKEKKAPAKPKEKKAPAKPKEPQKSPNEATDDPIHLARVKNIEDVDIEQFPWDQKVIVGNKMFKVQDDGSGNRVWKDVTPTAVPMGIQPIPMPSPQMAEAHQTAQAHEIQNQAQQALQQGRALGTNDTITHAP